MKNIILFGAPGCGKGTQSEILIEEFGLFQISTGDILREAIANETELGLKVKGILAEGGLVDDDTIIGLVIDKIENTDSNGFIFDGFPRTIEQANKLLAILDEKGMKLSNIFYMNVDVDVLYKRIDKRAAENAVVREDDNPEVLKKRISLYMEQTLPVIKHFESDERFVEIDASKSIEDVRSDIFSYIS